MQVSPAGSPTPSVNNSVGMNKVTAAEKPSRTDVAVAKHGLEAQKAQGAQVVDMIQKAGSIIDVVA